MVVSFALFMFATIFYVDFNPCRPSGIAINGKPAIHELLIKRVVKKQFRRLALASSYLYRLTATQSRLSGECRLSRAKSVVGAD
jgi:hypothetical protein